MLNIFQLNKNYKVPILTYHSIDTSGSVISIDPDGFKNQMRFLKDSSCNVISLNEAVMHLRNKRSFAKNSIVITFDDGFKNFFSEAFPVLQEYGFSATVFLTTNYCERFNNWPSQPSFIKAQPLLSWNDILEMKESGVQFGAHTHNHPSLTNIPLKDAENEILLSKQIIEDRLQEEVKTFAYPYGNFNTDIVNIVKHTFDGACTTELAIADSKSNPFLLERVDVFYIKQKTMFKKLLKPSGLYYIKCRKLLRDLRRRCF